MDEKRSIQSDPVRHAMVALLIFVCSHWTINILTRQYITNRGSQDKYPILKNIMWDHLTIWHSTQCIQSGKYNPIVLSIPIDVRTLWYEFDQFFLIILRIRSDQSPPDKITEYQYYHKDHYKHYRKHRMPRSLILQAFEANRAAIKLSADSEAFP